jgi:DNA-binding transcriptional LysR family regulator
MMLVAAPGNPLTAKESVGWEDLENCPLVLHGEGSIARQIILEEFGKRGLRPNIAAEVDNVAYVKQLVEGRGAVALMFSPNVEEDVAQNRLRVLSWRGGEIQIGIDVVVRKEAELAPACAAFLKVLGQQFGSAFDYGT